MRNGSLVPKWHPIPMHTQFHQKARGNREPSPRCCRNIMQEGQENKLQNNRKTLLFREDILTLPEKYIFYRE